MSNLASSASSPSTDQRIGSQAFSISTTQTATSLLTEAELTAAADLTLFDTNGNKVNFGRLFELQRTIVVFIRNFFCGTCQQYVSQLTTVRPEALDQTGTSIVIIGCGDWLLLKNYRDMTCPPNHSRIAYYTDPTRTVYRALGMNIETLETTPKGEEKKSYIKKGIVSNTVTSIMRALKNPAHLGKQGNISQLGGEFIFGPGNICSFGHHMRHTEDHVEIPQLFEEAGVSFP
ncbi:hypothetical protein M422DRAFT_266914 [Sphaerobolus stellatus SS14]|uniref:Thioredoxin-like protein AAED1 n=1 Tax=Sphaerobolus stellatus (strain SS14) TaxID=990650 RepID=A0A0C9V1Q9_SPHS4|nr:hypothetical protein M422DRAFT_266914 [Sphaerobolus stellatus SS14]